MAKTEVIGGALSCKSTSRNYGTNFSQIISDEKCGQIQNSKILRSVAYKISPENTVLYRKHTILYKH
jgi:hypothetical protein